MAFDLLNMDDMDDVEYVVTARRGEYETWAAAKAALIERTRQALEDAECEAEEKESELEELREKIDFLSARAAEVESLDGPESPEGYEPEDEQEERTAAFEEVARKLREVIPAGDTSPAAARRMIADEGREATDKERGELGSLATRLFRECGTV